MPKVYLSPAYHYWNPCAVAGCDETTHNNLYLDVLEPYLAACGIQYKRGPRRTPKSGEDGDALMLQAVRESDAWGADVHYVSHTNAANGGVRGYRPMIYPGSGGGRKLAACILKYRRKIYDQPIRLSESSVWYELRAPAAVSFYEEHVFHDNASDAQWFHSHLGAIAEATCRGLCEYFGIPYRAPGTAKPSPAPTIRKEEQVTVELRMLKRGMEDAMMDIMVANAAARGVKTIRGYYYPTAKNAMVREFYSSFGFEKVEETEDGSTTWQLDVAAYQPKHPHMKIER